MPPSPAPEHVFALIAAEPGAVWLDGGAADDGWSILAWQPTEVVTDPVDWIREGRRLTGRDPAIGLPFERGVIGYVGWDAAFAAEPSIPRRSARVEPPVWLARYEGAALYHHPTERWHLTGRARQDGVDLLRAARPLAPVADAPRRPRHTTARAAWEDGVRAVLEAIARGDVYQLNLTREVTTSPVDGAWSCWRRLRARSAPARGAFLRLNADTAVLSNSPEVFLDVRDGALRTVPIKGTAPAHEDPSRLAHSEKEIAELTMIVDLMRNDLGRVAVPGSVVAAPRRIVSHGYVLHAEQEVQAKLRADLDSWDAMGAAFPPGSVAGCPKVRAVQLLAGLEPEPRGVYCGAIGYAASHGDAAWSVAIRTAVIHRGAARYHVGAGIVADSSPAAEWDETEAKGTILAAALAGEGGRQGGS